MSVGHTYMHGGRFPSAIIPRIPPNFDYYLQSREGQDHLPEPKLPPPSSHSATGAAEDPDASRLEAAHSTGSTNDGGRSVEDPGGELNEKGLPGSGEGNLAWGGDFDDDRVEGAEDERGGDGGYCYWDDLDDRELVQYDDMFGDEI